MTDIKTLIEARAAADPRLKAVLKKIKEGTATFKDTAYYAEVYSSITGKVFSANVLDLVETEREEVCEELLRGNYEEINNICAQVQTALDEAAGIHIKPQRAAFPTDRVDQIAHSLLDPTVKDSVIKRRANTGVANVSQGFHDSYIKVNASFRNDSGLKVYINRETDGKCCEWCTKIAGRYSYGTEPDDIYRRHDNCGCTVTYENGKQRQDVWSKRSWTAPKVGAGAPPPTRFTPEQAAEIQARNTPRGLVNYSKDIDIFNDYGAPENADFTGKDIIENLKKSSIGNEILEYAPSMDKRIVLNYSIAPLDYAKRKIYGDEDGGLITVYMRNCEDAERAARTIIHECTHKRYGIGQSQWAECVCFAQELKHKYKRDSLTIAEKRRIIKAVKDGYPEYNWRKGGMIYGKRKDRI